MSRLDKMIKSIQRLCEAAFATLCIDADSFGALLDIATNCELELLVRR